MILVHGNVFKWKHLPRYWLFVRGGGGGDSPVIGEFPSQRPVTRSFDVFFDLLSNKRFSKQSRRRWFETSSRSLWRHCNADSGKAETIDGYLSAILCIWLRLFQRLHKLKAEVGPDHVRSRFILRTFASRESMWWKIEKFSNECYSKMPFD